MNLDKEIDLFFRANFLGIWSACKFLPKRKYRDLAEIFVFFKKTQMYLEANPPEIDQFEKYQSRLQDFRNQLEIYQNQIVEVSEEDFLLELFVKVEANLSIPEDWTDRFLEANKGFCQGNFSQLLHQTRSFFENSSEVLGRIIAKSLNLPAEIHTACGKLATSFYLLHWLRQIPINETRNKNVFPAELLKKHNLKNLSQEEAVQKTADFKAFALEILELSDSYLAQAEKNFDYVLDVYKPALRFLLVYREWLITRIRQNPFVIYKRYLEVNSTELLILKIKSYTHKIL